MKPAHHNLLKYGRKIVMTGLSAALVLLLTSLSFFIFPAYACVRTDGSDTLKILQYRTDSDGIKQVKNAAQWKKKRVQILDGMQQAMGVLPERKNLPDFNLRILDSLKEGGHTRYTINFTVAENEILPALLYVPVQKGSPRKLPAMLVLHETNDLGKNGVSGITGSKPNRSYAKELAERGYVVIAPDYPSFGDLKDHDFGKDRYESATMQGIFNHMRSVDLLQLRTDVDSERIGVIGHSLGGHNAMFVAAFDPRLKVTVASCGWTLFDAYNIGEDMSVKYGGRLGPWAQTRYMPLLRDKFKLDDSLIPFDFDDVIAAIAPRPFFSNSPAGDSNFNVEGVKRGVANALPAYLLFNAANNLQVRYPDAAHDFPPEVRTEAYRFIDSVLKHTPKEHKLLF